MHGGCGNGVYIYVKKQNCLQNEGFHIDKLILCILQLCFIENMELSQKEGDCVKKKWMWGKCVEKKESSFPKQEN